MSAWGGEQVEQAVAGAMAVLRTAADRDRDWDEVRAGRLEWSCRDTARHIATALTAYTWRLAARAQKRHVPYEIRLEDDADTAGLLDVVEAVGTLLAAAVRTTSPQVRAYHPYGNADREGFAAMGVVEVLLHTHDIAEGLGLRYEPAAELCEGVLTRLFPHVRPGAAPWPTLLWATGRGELPGRAPVTEWRWYNALAVPAGRLTLQGVTPAAARDLAGGGDGGFRWVEGGPYPGTREAAGMIVKAYEDGVHRPEWGMFALVRDEDGRAVGAMGFHGPPDEDGRAEIGYDLAEAARGHGYATEALRALSAWALDREGVRRLVARIDRDNGPSQRVADRAGFTRVADEGDLLVYELPR
jgi:RimJ/RimL family protein N-acetyltransferase